MLFVPGQPTIYIEQLKPGKLSIARRVNASYIVHVVARDKGSNGKSVGDAYFSVRKDSVELAEWNVMPKWQSKKVGAALLKVGIDGINKPDKTPFTVTTLAGSPAVQIYQKRV